VINQSRTLNRRISRLEGLRAQRKTPEPLVILVQSPESERELLAAERVVIDRFRHANNTVWARRRITSDLADNGLNCEPGGCLPDILAQFHDRCDWSKSLGACRMCQGTSIACIEKPTSEKEIHQ